MISVYMFICLLVGMSGKQVNIIMEELFEILKTGEYSIKSLSLKVNSQWLTTEKALSSMKKLGVVKERIDDSSNRKTRLFSLLMQDG
jgi:hypothetical protein